MSWKMKFDYKKRAHELFQALDEDGSGGITETEYVRERSEIRYFEENIKVFILKGIFL